MDSTPSLLLMAVVVASVTSCTQSMRAANDAGRVASRIWTEARNIAALTEQIRRNHEETERRLKAIREDIEKARAAQSNSRLEQ